ncbi:MAG: TlyA family RNA methyltransferase [Peptococcaceae bacterium]|nr:TlyA family RNA methyltransferase [Peptococcaceae bacterium]
MTAKKQRLDVFLFQNGYFESRERARAAIMAGRVRVNGLKVEKPGAGVDPEARVEVLGGLPYVSRGGLKLEKALRVFGVDLTGKVVLDVGASTGGFTDCALQNGAAMVYAVDVGYGQLAWKLRTDPRVVAIERTNIRNLDPAVIDRRPDFVTIDVSFISLEKVMPRVAELTGGQARGIALVKPQFEAGREKVGKKGVVRSPLTHSQVLTRVCSMMAGNGWGVIGMDFSPVRGPEGNIEYLMYFDLSTPGDIDPELIRRVVEEAHQKLGIGN